MQVNGMNYYVSLSSFDKKQEANILIRVPGVHRKILQIDPDRIYYKG